jgi:hypothetical protein
MRALANMNMCQILTIHLTLKKIMDKKQGFQANVLFVIVINVSVQNGMYLVINVSVHTGMYLVINVSVHTGMYLVINVSV